MLRLALDLVEPALTERDPQAAAQAFASQMRRLSPSYLQIRRYRRPGGALTSKRHWQAGGHLVREARAGWIGSSGFQYICFDCNPLLGAVTQKRTRYRASDFAPRGDRQFGAYWDAFSSAAIADVWCANAYGADDTVASVHIGIDDPAIEPAVGEALQVAGAVLAERLLSLDAAYPESPGRSPLTRREADVMRFVADGKTDWEIGVILSVSEATARFHADNARRKLGASNRAHAAARFVAGGDW